MRFDPEKVRVNVRGAETEDLLDRLTFYSEGMEPEALDLIEAELRRRGVGREQIEAHAAGPPQEVLRLDDGTAVRCSFCRRPAVAAGWGWHRLWGVLPVFPRRFAWCAGHRPPVSPP
jgi:hypothetical protein